MQWSSASSSPGQQRGFEMLSGLPPKENHPSGERRDLARKRRENKKQKKRDFCRPNCTTTAQATNGAAYSWCAGTVAIPTTPATPLFGDFSAFGLVGIDTV
jgi:hypothetical protein